MIVAVTWTSWPTVPVVTEQTTTILFLIIEAFSLQVVAEAYVLKLVVINLKGLKLSPQLVKVGGVSFSIKSIVCKLLQLFKNFAPIEVNLVQGPKFNFVNPIHPSKKCPFIVSTLAKFAKSMFLRSEHPDKK